MSNMPGTDPIVMERFNSLPPPAQQAWCWVKEIERWCARVGPEILNPEVALEAKKTLALEAKHVWFALQGWGLDRQLRMRVVSAIERAAALHEAGNIEAK